MLLAVSWLLLLITSFASEQDVEIDYFKLRIAVYTGMSYLRTGGPFETPIIIHIAHMLTVPQYNCLAYYDTNKLDILTLKRPKINTPSEMHTTNQRTLCIGYMWAIAADFIYPSMIGRANFDKKVESILKPIYSQFGLTDIQFNIHSDVYSCNGNKKCLNNIAQQYNYSPYIIASIIMEDIIEEFENDGWNMFGLETSNNDEICEANCYPYSDTTNYKPKPDTFWTKLFYPNSWLPLLETDNKGFFYKSEHVTPHIGIKGKKYLLNEFKCAQDPSYNYEKEANDLIERLKILATNDYQKAAVEFFDDKLQVRGLIQTQLEKNYGELITMEKYVEFIVGISFAEHDAILQAWKQKVYFDRIRPTTVIQRWGDREIETYAGPYQGVKIIKAKYFEPYIRVMPHSEYPSGSACICTAYKEFTDLFVNQYFGENSLYNMSWPVMKGSSFVEPDMTPREDLIIDIKDMTELAYLCGESRLWGGMHFRKSVDEANRICSGIGEKAMHLLKNAGKSRN